MIKIEYTFSAQDFRALTFYTFRPNLRVRLILTTIAMLYVAFFSVLPLLYEGNGLLEAFRLLGVSLLTGTAPYSTYLILIGAFLLIWFIEYVSQAIRTPLYLKRTCAVIGTQMIGLGDDFFEISDKTADAKIKWSAFHKIIVTRDHILLVIRYPIVKMIPRRTFQSPAGFDEALAFIKSHVNKGTLYETR